MFAPMMFHVKRSVMHIPYHSLRPSAKAHSFHRITSFRSKRYCWFLADGLGAANFAFFGPPYRAAPAAGLHQNSCRLRRNLGVKMTLLPLQHLLFPPQTARLWRKFFIPTFARIFRIYIHHIFAFSLKLTGVIDIMTYWISTIIRKQVISWQRPLPSSIRRAAWAKPPPV